MIIQKQDTTIKASNVRPLENLLLIKPDENYQTFQRKGVDLDIATSNFSYNEKGQRVAIKERNYSVMGTVYALPSRLYYAGHKLEKIGTDNGHKQTPDGLVVSDESRANQVGDMRKRSLIYGTEMELNVGDRIRFSYTAHMEAESQGMGVDTDEGRMFFMKYDKAFMVIDENNQPKKMLNGYILAKPEILDTTKEDGVEGTMVGSLLIPSLKTKENRKRKTMKGEVVLSGAPLTGYMHFLGEREPICDPNPCDRIIFDPRGSKRLEPLNHQHHEEDLYLLHRRSLVFVSDYSTNFVERLEQLKI